MYELSAFLTGLILGDKSPTLSRKAQPPDLIRSMALQDTVFLPTLSSHCQSIE